MRPRRSYTPTRLSALLTVCMMPVMWRLRALAAAVKMYEMGRLSSGAAAELAGVPRTVFLSKLADYGVATFRLSKAEVRADAERA